jgi:redox-sensitive bicupin YhaK (pirin superfamily)
MSGPVTPADAEPRPEGAHPDGCVLEVTDGHAAEVGGVAVRRALPQRPRRTVGAWCFADHLGPAPAGTRLAVGPHPHIGLQTVTWLVSGELLHRDSLGSEQPIRPGQLNLMTAGHGVSHSEEPVPGAADPLHGIQLWVAQPAATRDGEAAFEHHAELPAVEIGGCTATVLVGEVAGIRSPARADTDHLGADLVVPPGDHLLPLHPGAEHALVVLDGAVEVHGSDVVPGQLGYLGIGHDEVLLSSRRTTRVVLLGGTPFPEPVLMWWNYVARTRDEVTAAHRSWTDDDGRFGHVDSPLERIVVGPPPWSRPDGGAVGPQRGQP